MLPENTMAGFRYAIEAGVDAIELDVLVSADDVPVVCHDPVLNRRWLHRPRHPRSIRALTFGQLRQLDCGAKTHPRFPHQQAAPGERIPSLDEVLALAPRGRFWFNIEAKLFRYRPSWTPAPERFANLVLECIRRHGLESRVIFQSFDFRILKAMAKLEPCLRLAALDQFGLRGFAATARRAGTRIVAPASRLVTRRRVALTHSAGIQVFAWTANRSSTWKRLIDARVDGIITDDPAGLLAYLRGVGLR